VEGEPPQRQRYRQLVRYCNTPPEKVDISILQPKAEQLYYETCGKIDQHNCDRQSMLGLEHMMKTINRERRVNMSLLVYA
jgi:hypothetical protein